MTTINQLPKDILVNIAYLVDQPSTFARVCKNWKAVQDAVFEGLKNEYLRNPSLSDFVKCAIISNPQATNSEIVKSVYFRDISLVKFFEALAADKEFPCQAAQAFLSQLTGRNESEKARAIRKWMNDPTNLQNIKFMNLSNAGLTSLPPEIALFSNLIALNLVDNALKSLPKEMGKLQNLRGLFLRGGNNELDMIPSEIENLPKLSDLTRPQKRTETPSPKEIGNQQNLSVRSRISNILSIFFKR